MRKNMRWTHDFGKCHSCTQDPPAFRTTHDSFSSDSMSESFDSTGLQNFFGRPVGLCGIALVAQEPGRESELVFYHPKEIFQRSQSRGKSPSYDYEPGSGDNNKDGTVFGLPVRHFAKFALPSGGPFCDRLFDFDIADARVYLHRKPLALDVKSQIDSGRPFESLSFVSYPCQVSPVKDVTESSFKIGADRIDRFNIVCAFSRSSPVKCFSAASGKDRDNTPKYSQSIFPLPTEFKRMFFQVIASVGKAILAEESRCCFLSTEIAKIKSAAIRQGTAKSSAVARSSTLARDIVKIYEQLQFVGAATSLYINDCILINVGLMAPGAELVSPPGTHQALLLLEGVESIQVISGFLFIIVQAQLPVDCVSTVRRVIDQFVEPTRRLSDVATALGLPVGAVQRIGQHLVYWHKAKIINPLNRHQVLVVSPTATFPPDGVDSDEFSRLMNAWHGKYLAKEHVPGATHKAGDNVARTNAVSKDSMTQHVFATQQQLTLSMVEIYIFFIFQALSFFTHGEEVGDAKKRFPVHMSSRFNKLCCWLLRKGLVVFSQTKFFLAPTPVLQDWIFYHPTPLSDTDDGSEKWPEINKAVKSVVEKKTEVLDQHFDTAAGSTAFSFWNKSLIRPQVQPWAANSKPGRVCCYRFSSSSAADIVNAVKEHKLLVHPDELQLLGEKLTEKVKVLLHVPFFCSSHSLKGFLFVCIVAKILH
jgi:hypothetical protein